MNIKVGSTLNFDRRFEKDESCYLVILYGYKQKYPPPRPCGRAAQCGRLGALVGCRGAPVALCARKRGETQYQSVKFRSYLRAVRECL